MSELRTCQHLRTSGNLCQSPALRHNTLCYFHYRLAQREQRRLKLGGPTSPGGNTGIELPLLEDAESIQVAIIEVARALVDQRIDEKRAGLLLYSFQLALQNVRNLKPQNEKSEAPYVLDTKDSRWEGALEDSVDPETEPFDQAPDTTEITIEPGRSGRHSMRDILRELGFEDPRDRSARQAAKPPVHATLPAPSSAESSA